MSRISHRQQGHISFFLKHPFSFLTLFSWNFACVLCLECSNIFNDLYFLIKRQRCAKEHSAISATDRDYSTLGALLMPCNTILDEPLMFWHDWLTKTPPIKATYRRKWDLWGGGDCLHLWQRMKGWGRGSSKRGWSQRIAVVFLGKVNLLSPKRQMSNVLGPCGLWTEHSSQAAGVFTGIKEETLYAEVTDSCASSQWQQSKYQTVKQREKRASARGGRLDLRKRQTALSCFCESTTSCAFLSLYTTTSAPFWPDWQWERRPHEDSCPEARVRK